MKQTLSIAFAVALVIAFASASQAQVGSGWNSYSSSHNRSACSGGYYSNSGGVETFRISGDCNRSEIHLTPDFSSSGSYQFEGYVNVRAGANKNSIHQTMSSPGGDAQQIRVYNSNGGYLKILQNQQQIATGVYGKYVRVNVIYYNSNKNVDTYINGSKKATINISGVGGGTRYWKYGVYGHQESNPQVQWKGIKTFKK